MFRIFLPLLDDAQAHPTNYGFTMRFYMHGRWHTALNGPGTNYVFWDYLNPYPRIPMIIADITQQLIAPVQFSQITASDGTNRLERVNVPIGRHGFVIQSPIFKTGRAPRLSPAAIGSQTVFVPASARGGCYRLRFPFA